MLLLIVILHCFTILIQICSEMSPTRENAFGKKPTQDMYRNYDNQDSQQSYSTRHPHAEAEYFRNDDAREYVAREEYERLQEMYLQVIDQQNQLQIEVEQQARLIQVTSMDLHIVSSFV